jgi:Icc-related predicted phosphoesterase
LPGIEATLRGGPARPLAHCALALADEPPHAPIPELVAALEPELILLLGDLEPAWTDGLAELDLPKLGVLGNHDAPGALQAVGARDLHLRVVEHGGLTFAGFGWTAEEQAAELLAQLPAVDVLLTHAPPAGVNDEPDDPIHRGSPALRAWVERHEPRVLLHGHTLPAIPIRQLGRTRIVYVRGATPVDLS